MENFCSVHDVKDMDQLIQKALEYKSDPFKHKNIGQGRRIGLIFLNPSLRTRISTQVAALNLGLEPIVFNMGKEGWSLELEDGVVMNGTSVEHIKDAAPVLGQYFDILCLRSFAYLQDRDTDYSEQVLHGFIKYSGLPVISLESATLHPLQSLADMITIKEQWHHKVRPKIVLTWAPHIKPLPQAVSNSFAQWVNAWGKADFVITHPEGMELDISFTTGATITHRQEEALVDADFVYVKNWSGYNTYGQLAENADHWMLDQQKLATTANARIMHCLPVRRNVELSDELLDSAASLVTEQAANRVWAAQAVMAALLNHPANSVAWKN